MTLHLFLPLPLIGAWAAPAPALPAHLSATLPRGSATLRASGEGDVAQESCGASEAAAPPLLVLMCLLSRAVLSPTAVRDCFQFEPGLFNGKPGPLDQSSTRSSTRRRAARGWVSRQGPPQDLAVGSVWARGEAIAAATFRSFQPPRAAAAAHMPAPWRHRNARRLGAHATDAPQRRRLPRRSAAWESSAAPASAALDAAASEPRRELRAGRGS